MAREIVESLCPIPPEDVVASEVIEAARSHREAYVTMIEDALVNGTEDSCVIAYRRGAPVTLAEYLRR
jgi:hypothetical protein